MMIDFSKLLPKMLFGDELRMALEVLPDYDDSVRELDAGTRLLMLSDIYKIFIPNSMAHEIYYKLYSMAVMSLQKKGTVEAVKMLNAVHQGKVNSCDENSISNNAYMGVATGMTSATCIGVSGIGKSTCIQAAIGLLGGIIENEVPYRKIIPAIVVSTPFNCSFRSLCSQILDKVDEFLKTNFYPKSLKSSMNAEQVMQMVCQVANLYIGVLVIDEIQMLVESKSGNLIYKMILQLINMSGISVLLCGTPECIPFFSQNPQMARRTVGLQFGSMNYDEEFKEFCKILFSYQYVKKRTELTDSVLEWLFEHSGAIPAGIMALVHDAQEIAILNGKEKICIETLNEAYNRRMKMLHPYISPNIKSNKRYAAIQSKGEQLKIKEKEIPDDKMNVDIPIIIKTAKNQGVDIVGMLRQFIPVREVIL